MFYYISYRFKIIFFLIQYEKEVSCNVKKVFRLHLLSGNYVHNFIMYAYNPDSELNSHLFLEFGPL